jgi:elongation factor P
MENDSGEIFDISKDLIEDITGYLKDNLDVFLQIYNGNVINVLLPSTITYKITSTVPGVKGDRAQAGTKPATIETGMEIQVPLYKEEGDEVTVNTLTGVVS